MEIYEEISSSHSLSRPCSLTIGSFDGVHLGHQKIFKRMREMVGSKGTVCVCTFSNHPSQLLKKEDPTPLIFSNKLKLKTLEKYDVDIVYCIPFTTVLAEKTYKEFLSQLMQSCPFDYLILGEGASLGKKREGTPQKVLEFGKTLGFQTEYLSLKKEEETHISSGTIRTHINEGNLEKAVQLLGHPYSIEGTIQSKQMIVDPRICLPPNGVYPVVVNGQHEMNIHIKKPYILISCPDGNIQIDFC